MHRVLAVAAAVLLGAAGCGDGADTISQGGTAVLPPTTTATAIATAPATAPVTSPSTQPVSVPRPTLTTPTSQATIVTAPILGVWVQDDTGPGLNYRRRFEFRPDGSYQFLFTSRPTGSMSEQVLTAESGRYSVNGDRLSLSPMAGTPSHLGWRIDADPYVGGMRLSVTLPDGTLGIYYRP